MRDSILYWWTGCRERVSGDSIGDAVNRAGYSRGAVPVLGFCTEGRDEWRRGLRHYPDPPSVPRPVIAYLQCNNIRAYMLYDTWKAFFYA